MSNLKETPATVPPTKGGNCQRDWSRAAEQQAGRRIASCPQSDVPLDDGVVSIGDAVEALLRKM